ncbi:MAG: thiamine pyrophosphate-dependent enzyme, partial [Pseudomonadota bacterium]
PGIQLDPLYDAFYKHRNRIRVIQTRHEQGAAFMAMGYAQSSEKTGVFAVVPGPGLLNAMAAVCTAEGANTPVLGLTGQIPSYQIGLNYGIAHELRDQIAMSRGVVGWAERADHAAEVPGLMCSAFGYMRSGRNLPAVLEMAPDGYAGKGAVTTLPAAEPAAGPPLDPAQIEAAAARLASAKRPAIYIGGGVFGAETPLMALAEKLNAPVIDSVSGRGAFPADHPLYFNTIAGQKIWEDVDVAVAIGTRFLAQSLVWGRGDEVDIIRIDVDPRQIVKPTPAVFPILAAATEALPAMIEALPDRPEHPEWLAACDEARQSAEAELRALGAWWDYSAAVRSALPRDGILVVDPAQFGHYARYAFPAFEPKTVLGAGYQATLGYAYPAALGVKLANPEKKVVAVAGDGGFLFTGQELAVAAQQGVNVVGVVFDNAGYMNVKMIQDRRFGARNIAVDLHNPDFVALAEAYGIAAEKAETPEQLEDALTRHLAADHPALIHVPIGEVPWIWDLIKRPPTQGNID